MAPRLLALALLLAVGLGVGLGWWRAWGGETSLGYRLERAKTTAELVDVIPALLEVGSHRAQWMLNQKSQQRAGFAFDAEHGVVVVHDAATGAIHWFLGPPWGQPGAPAPAPGAGPGVRRAVETHGAPPRRFVETRCITAAPGEVWCVLRPEDRSAPWLALQFTTVEGALRRGRTQDLDGALRERLRATGRWPNHWEPRPSAR